MYGILYGMKIEFHKILVTQKITSLSSTIALRGLQASTTPLELNNPRVINSSFASSLGNVPVISKSEYSKTAILPEQ